MTGAESAGRVGIEALDREVVGEAAPHEGALVRCGFWELLEPVCCALLEGGAEELAREATAPGEIGVTVQGPRPQKEGVRSKGQSTTRSSGEPGQSKVILVSEAWKGKESKDSGAEPPTSKGSCRA